MRKSAAIAGSPALLGVKRLGKMERKLLAKRFKLKSLSKSDNQADGARWTIERLRRAVRRAVRERLADATLERTPRRPPEDRLMMMAAGIAMANPEMSLRAIGAQLEAMRERTPRGGRRWAASSVKHLLDQAERLGLTPSTVIPPD